MVSVAKIGWSIVIVLAIIIGAFLFFSSRMIGNGPLMIPPVFVNATLLEDISEYGFPLIRIDSVDSERPVYCLKEGENISALFLYGLDPVRIFYRSIPYERVESGPNEGARIGRPPITTRDEDGNIVITLYSDREINREEELPGLQPGSRFTFVKDMGYNCGIGPMNIDIYRLI